MQIIKPKRLGLISKTYQFKENIFCVGAVAFFSMGKDPVLLEENKQWVACGAQLPQGTLLDVGFAKPQGEVLMVGKAYKHQHGLLKESKPGIKIGPIKKIINVKNKELDGNVIEKFLPTDITAKPRSRYNGKYDKKWLKHVYPGFPLDTDPRLFNAAPEELQLKKHYFMPGQDYALFDLSKEVACFQGRLPNIGVRMFIHQDVDNEEKLVELTSNLDTVWFFPEIATGVAIYRGTTAVSDSDGLDVKRLLLACERVDLPSRSVDYYKHVLALRSNPEAAVGHMFNESQLMPQRTEEEERARAKLYEEALQDQNEKINAMSDSYKALARERIAAAVPPMFPGQDKLESALNEVEPNASADDVDLDIPPIPKSLIDSGDFDLTPLIEKSKAAQEKMNERMEKQQKAMEAMAEQYEKKYEKEIKDITVDIPTLKARVFERVFVVAEDLGEKHTSGASVEKLNSLLQSIPEETKNKLAKENKLNTTTLQIAYEHMAKAGRQARQSGPECMQDIRAAKAHADTLRAWAKQLLDNHESLAGMDFSGANLSGMDFRGCDLRDLMLECADLTGCRFDDARMDGCVLAEAILDNACFDQACLNNANLCKSHGTKVSFKQATFHQSLLNAAELIDCDFSGATFVHAAAQDANFTFSCFNDARADECLFPLANLERSSWAKATLKACILTKVKMAASSWPESNLERCVFLDVAAEGVDFSKARLLQVQFSNVGDLSSANFQYSVCRVCGFRGVNMRAMKAQFAVFIECDFSETILHDAIFQEALLSDCLLMKTDFLQSDCRRSWFNQCILRKSMFNKVNLRYANFHYCDQAELQVNDCKTWRVKQYPSGAIR